MTVKPDASESAELEDDAKSRGEGNAHGPEGRPPGH